METRRYLNRILDRAPSPRERLAQARPDLSQMDIDDMPDHLVEHILEAIQDME